MQIHHRKDEERRSHDIQKQNDDIRRLTRERDEERTKLRSKDREIERLQHLLKEQHLHAASMLERENRDIARQVCSVSTKWLEFPLEK